MTQGVLELVLVWVICGMVADMAGRAGDETTRRKAATRRLIYVVLKVVIAAGVVLFW